jgi:hypothetical protein
MRSQVPAIPDFTSSTWHDRRSDAQMVASILTGKGTAMPSFRGKLRDSEARDLVAYLRSLAQGPRRSSSASSSEFSRRFQQLVVQFDELDRQYRELASKQSGAGKETPHKDVE